MKIKKFRISVNKTILNIYQFGVKKNLYWVKIYEWNINLNIK